MNYTLLPLQGILAFISLLALRHNRAKHNLRQVAEPVDFKMISL